MIDSKKTLETFGYEIKNLSSQSHKKVIAICEDCGKERCVPIYAYRDMCGACVRKRCYLSDETRVKLSNSKIGEKNHFYGKQHNDETKKRISKSLSANVFKLPHGECNRNKVVYYYKKGAKLKNLNFCLSDTEMDGLFSGRCHYCGAYPNNIKDEKNTNGPFIFNGIDRKNNQLGYTKDNCVSCCTLCNFTKRDMDYDDFLLWIENAYNYVIKRK